MQNSEIKIKNVKKISTHQFFKYLIPYILNTIMKVDLYNVYKIRNSKMYFVKYILSYTIKKTMKRVN